MKLSLLSEPTSLVTVTTNSSADVEERLGALLFRHRVWTPFPLMVPLLIYTPGTTWQWSSIAGSLLIVAGELTRVWAVRHIGSVSRTRAVRVGRLVTTGPYGWTRNPLYIGNGLLWTGFVLFAGEPWLLPFAWAVFALQQAVIVPWEESLLLARYPLEYREYQGTVPRWWPLGQRRFSEPAPCSWSHVLLSERGTLLAIASMAIVLVIRRLLG